MLLGHLDCSLPGLQFHDTSCSGGLVVLCSVLSCMGCGDVNNLVVDLGDDDLDNVSLDLLRVDRGTSPSVATNNKYPDCRGGPERLFHGLHRR